MDDLGTTIKLPDGRAIDISAAQNADAPKILHLYHQVYGANYPFSLVYNIEECLKAINNEKYLWLLARRRDEPIGSVIFAVDRDIALAKVFGAAVTKEYRGFNLAEQTIRLGLEHLIEKTCQAKSVYATIRTVDLGPQRLVEKLGFKKLGIFPNVHKVQASETHTLAVYYAPDSLKGRQETPRLPLILKPFFEIVRRQTGIPEAQFIDLPVAVQSSTGPATPFEAIHAQQFIARRFREMKSSGILELDFFPFHEPNLLLVSAGGESEIYCYRSAKDGHCVITGAKAGKLPMRILLDHGTRFLGNLGAQYVEVLRATTKAEPIREALNAGFLPSAYYPAMRWNIENNSVKDYIVLSRSLVMLDFKGIALQPAYADYLREYLRLWTKLHIEQAFEELSIPRGQNLPSL